MRNNTKNVLDCQRVDNHECVNFTFLRLVQNFFLQMGIKTQIQTRRYFTYFCYTSKYLSPLTHIPQAKNRMTRRRRKDQSKIVKSDKLLGDAIGRFIIVDLVLKSDGPLLFQLGGCRGFVFVAEISNMHS